MTLDLSKFAWDKMNGLLPAIIQDSASGMVLMLGYMNREALEVTLRDGLVTFYSRSKNRLWTKGETSGNRLVLETIQADCDDDALLITATPAGPVCHKGVVSCFGDTNPADWSVILALEAVIKEREQSRPENSYTTHLLNAGIARLAQKVGEEGVEVALAAVAKSDAEICNEMADLLFHMLVLLRAKNLGITDVMKVLKDRRS